MTFWAVLAAAAGLVLIAVVVIGGGRPRSAEDELGQPKLKPVPFDIESFDTRAALKLVLQTAEAGRETGTLHVTASGRTCSLYFLFGHLFHAASDTLTGEAAVKDCLTWQDVGYAWDVKAPLPTAETIERPLDQILAA